MSLRQNKSLESKRNLRHILLLNFAEEFMSKDNLADQLKKNLRKNPMSLRGSIAMVLFGAIVMVFVFFGYSTKNAGGDQGQAATVNNAYISIADFQNEVQRLEQMYGAFFGGQMPPGAQRQFLQGQAIESLISMELMAQGAAKQKIWTSDAELRDFILTEVPAFQQEGVFKRDRYEGILQANNWSTAEFEGKVRKDRQSQRLRRLVEISVSGNNLEIEKTRELQATKINLEFIKFDKDSFAAQANIDEATITQKLSDKKNKKRDKIEYKNKKAELDQPEQIKAQHILVKIDDKTKEKEALEKAKGIQKKLAAGGDFSKLAKENSDDTGSKDKGGDLGYFSAGKMVPEFEKAAFSQKVGEVGEPIKSNFGYHIIKVNDKKPALPAIIEHHQKKIAKRLLGEEVFEKNIKQIEEALKNKDVAGFEAKVKEMKLAWEETGYFDMSNSMIPKVASASAADSALKVLKTKGVATELFREGAVAFVFKYKDVKKEAPKTPDMDQNASKQKAAELLNQWVDQERKSARIEKNAQISAR